MHANLSEVNWDGTVALAYTAEQLFAAAQLLTSDTIPPEHALALACSKHISALLDYREFLPGVIAQKLEIAQQTCHGFGSKAASRQDAQQLANQVVAILREVSDELNELQTRRGAA